MFDLKNKTIVLTGAAGGLGSAIAYELSTAGATLILVDRNNDALAHLNEQLGGQHHCQTVDLSDDTQRQQLVSFCRDLPDGIDMLINNAGISDFSLLANTTASRIASVIAVNLISPIQLCNALLPLLHAKTAAMIVNVGSTFGSIGFPGFSLYASTKFGMRGFTESLRRELADSMICVKYFAPRAAKTAINTDKVVAMNTELGSKMDAPSEVASHFIQFIQSRHHSYYVGWPEKLFVKINSLLPSLVDKSILKQLPIIKRYL
ncbi:MAG: SDR family oxidoreductase [Gammaproteobacteria bacterium]|nr:SDR family oxidoreductase [Gammaproteobacteria bacterium]MDT8371459.1 SDR family oxidoreductase [Gammaproteobacteria bacterium]